MKYISTLVVIVAVVFGPALGNPLVMWDDPIYILFNPVVRDWWSASWWDRVFTPNLGYPVALPVAIYSLVGAESAFLIHSVSLCFHIANAVLVYLLFCRFVHRTTSVAFATLWAVHPVVVESVAWATNLKELLVSFAILCALCSWGWSESVLKRRFVLFTMFIIGALSKPTIVVLAPILLALCVIESRLERKRLIEIVAIGAFSGIWLMVAQTMHSSLLDPNAFELRDPVVTLFSAIGIQLKNYLYPTTLQAYYPVSLAEWGPMALVGVGTTLVLVCALGGAWRTRQYGILFGLSFFFVAYTPYSNLVPLPRFTADTYFYLPSVGLVLCFAVVSEKFIERLQLRLLTIGLVGVLLAGLTIKQIQRWESTEALMSPLLGQPALLTLPYELVAFEHFLLGDEHKSVELLKEVWPHLERNFPRFAPSAFVAAGDLDFAYRAVDDWARAEGTPAAKEYAERFKKNNPRE